MKPKNFLIPCIIFCLAIPVASFGKDNKKSTGDDSAVTQWIDGMQAGLPAAFCKDKSYFRECFKVTETECEKEAIRVTRICLEAKKEDIKANLQKDGGRKWGEKVGQCAGQSYEITFKDKRVDNAKCNDPSQWI